MKIITLEWVNKAEADFATASRELRARKNPNFDACCYHAQQCAEKYLKAFLQEQNIVFTKTHDLNTLANLCISIDQLFTLQTPILNLLNPYSVAFRYPGNDADRDDAKTAYRATIDFRIFARSKSGLH